MNHCYLMVYFNHDYDVFINKIVNKLCIHLYILVTLIIQVSYLIGA